MLLSKPVFGDPSPSTALVVRARRLRNKRTGEEKVQAEILGIIPRTYSFNGLMDFQYGPFEKLPPEQCNIPGKSDQFRVFYDKLIVREPTRSLDLHLDNDAPLCVPPILFTRLDQPLAYCFSSRFRTNEYIELDSQSQNHPYHRKERKSYAMFVNFNEPTPMAAHPSALEAISNLPAPSRKLAHDIEKTSSFRFNRSSWPDARQILYQLTDIDVPEVVEMLAAPVPRSKCDPVEGWMPDKHQKTIRESITRCLDAWLALEEEATDTKEISSVRETAVAQEDKTEEAEKDDLDGNRDINVTPGKFER
nr:unnamed protein product [Spirometra erinaceieuropaei]